MSSEKLEVSDNVDVRDEAVAESELERCRCCAATYIIELMPMRFFDRPRSLDASLEQETAPSVRVYAHEICKHSVQMREQAHLVDR